MMRNTEKSPMNFTKQIPAVYAGLASQKLNKILKRASKKGLEGQLTFQISAPHKIDVELPTEARVAPKTTQRWVVDVTVDGVVPKINGWEFVAKLTFDSGTKYAVATAAPGQQIPARYRKEQTAHCDHCAKSRRRRETFVLRHSSGRLQVVGRTCLKDFFPNINVEWVIDYFNYIDQLTSEFDDDDCWTDRDRAYAVQHASTTLLDVVAYSNATIRRDGWMSKTKANQIAEQSDYENQPTPTSVEINEQVAVAIGLRRPGRHFEPVDVTKADFDLAEKVIEFVRNEMRGDNDYVFNMKNFFDSEHVQLRYIPFVASAVPAYNRHLGQIEERKNAAPSNWVGMVGDKIDPTDVTVVMKKYVSSHFGTSALLRMKDESGNTFSTFTTAAWSDVVENGSKLTITGTVKKHDDFKGLKSTMLNRVKNVGEIVSA